MTKDEEFWNWIMQCPHGVFENHESTDDEGDHTIYVFGFAVPKEKDDK